MSDTVRHGVETVKGPQNKVLQRVAWCAAMALVVVLAPGCRDEWEKDDCVVFAVQAPDTVSAGEPVAVRVTGREQNLEEPCQRGGRSRWL